MEKLKIVARMKSPFVKVGYMTLDGLLGALKFDELHDIELAHQSIPVQQTNGLFHASAAIFESIDRQKQTFIAAIRPEHSLDSNLILKNKKGQLHRKFDSSFTNVLNTYSVITAPTISWFVQGDADQIQRLLKPVQFIGKRRASGFGEVSSWDIEADELDGIVGMVGEPLRPIPVDMFRGDKTFPVIDAAWKPAYWNILNRTACYAPAE